LLYRFLKIWVILASKIFCRKISINLPDRLQWDGPLLLAANHPNSFLDAILLNILFKKPIWSLARGDVFKTPFFIKLLTKLKILPVYRTSEGVENLEINYKTFDACKEIFRSNGIVLVFSEGKCVNEWHLRPLKKGTARLAIGSWQSGIFVKVLPVGINYSSFRKFGKNVFLNFGEVISKENIDINLVDGKMHFEFNTILNSALNKLVFEIPGENKEMQKERLHVNQKQLTRLLLFLPAIFGYVVHAPLYYPVKSFSSSKTIHTGHYDSVIISLLIFLYPVYLILIVGITLIATGNLLFLFGLILLPFSAWALVKLKPQTDG